MLFESLIYLQTNIVELKERTNCFPYLDNEIDPEQCQKIDWAIFILKETLAVVNCGDMTVPFYEQPRLPKSIQLSFRPRASLQLDYIYFDLLYNNKQ